MAADKISARVFIFELLRDIAEHAEPFVNNMDLLEMENKNYIEWIDTFSAWMDWNVEITPKLHYPSSSDLEFHCLCTGARTGSHDKTCDLWQPQSA